MIPACHLTNRRQDKPNPSQKKIQLETLDLIQCQSYEDFRKFKKSLKWNYYHEFFIEENELCPQLLILRVLFK